MAVAKATPKGATATRSAGAKTKAPKVADQRFQQAKRASILLVSASGASIAAANVREDYTGNIRAHSGVCRKISLFSDVAFLQQALTKRAMKPQLRLSSVACSELFVSYRPATEGGIPRSSRFRWFA